MSEGYWGGYVGPWVHRQKFDFSFWEGDPANNNTNNAVRAKWTGNALPNLYNP